MRAPNPKRKSVMKTPARLALIALGAVAGCNQAPTNPVVKAPAAAAARSGDAVARPILAANLPSPHDWPMWGRTPTRQSVTDEKGLPTDFDAESGKNIKWSAQLGSQSYGNP